MCGLTLNDFNYNLIYSILMEVQKSSEKKSISFQIGLVGDSCSGKTSLLERYTKNLFHATSWLTIGVSFYEKHVIIRNKIVYLKLFDMTGCEAFTSSNEFSLKNLKMHGVLLVYDVSKSQNLEVIHRWIKFLRKIKSEAVILLVGNKIDLTSPRAVSLEFVREFSMSQNLKFIECSAKTGENINELFDYLVEKLLQINGYIPSELDEIGNPRPDEEIHGIISRFNKADTSFAGCLRLFFQDQSSTNNANAKDHCHLSPSSESKPDVDDTSKSNCDLPFDSESNFFENLTRCESLIMNFTQR